MDDLVKFIRDRLAEDAEVVRRNSDGNGLDGGFPDYRTYVDEHTDAADEYIAHFSAARMAIDIAAKRDALELYDHMRSLDHPSPTLPQAPTVAWWGTEWLKLLAKPYADHADYRDKEWKL